MENIFLYNHKMGDTDTAKLICACFFFMYFSWAIIDDILNRINRNMVDEDREENNRKSDTDVQAIGENKV